MRGLAWALVPAGVMFLVLVGIFGWAAYAEHLTFADVVGVWPFVVGATTLTWLFGVAEYGFNNERK